MKLSELYDIKGNGKKYSFKERIDACKQLMQQSDNPEIKEDIKKLKILKKKQDELGLSNEKELMRVLYSYDTDGDLTIKQRIEYATLALYVLQIDRNIKELIGDLNIDIITYTKQYKNEQKKTAKHETTINRIKSKIDEFEKEVICGKFRKVDLLNEKEMMYLFSDDNMITEVAEIIANKLKKYAFINKNGVLYVVNEYKVFKAKRNLEDTLLTLMTEYLGESFKAIDTDTELKMIKTHGEKQFKKKVKYIVSNMGIKQYLPQLRTYLLDEKLELDNYTWQLHFKNGYLDLTTGKLHKRELGTDYVSYCVDFDYIPSTQKDRDTIECHAKKIFPDRDDRECVFSKIAACLVGTPEVFQDTLFLIGEGSGGKSFLLELTTLALQDYVKFFSGKILEDGHKDRNKIFNEFIDKGYIRIAWANEFSDKKMDSSDLKNLADGKIATTQLYHDGQTTIILKAKLIATSNNMIKIVLDSGVVRRFEMMTPESKFVDTPEEVDEKNHKYLKDTNLLKKIAKQPNLLNAWIDILASHCIRIHNNDAPKTTPNFTNTMKEVIAVNDEIQQFIDNNFILTGNEADRIHKDDMEKLFREKHPKKFISWQQLYSELKKRGLKYDSDRLRVKGKKGLYYGIKLQMEYLFDESNEKRNVDMIMESNDQLEKENKTLKRKVIDQDNEIMELKKEIEMLKQKLETTCRSAAPNSDPCKQKTEKETKPKRTPQKEKKELVSKKKVDIDVDENFDDDELSVDFN